MRNRSQVVLPINVEHMIPEGDPVFLVAEICDELDYTELYNQYLRTWRKTNPITIFEVILFSYLSRRYGTRQMEEQCRTDIRFMWLLQGEPVPDHVTISRFMTGKLANVIEDLFYQFVEKLFELEEIRFANLFVDGTKIEANAGKYTFKWKPVVEKSLERIQKKIDVHLPIICERYGLNAYTGLEDAYEALVHQAAFIEMVFLHGKGKHKTQLQRDIEQLKEYIDKKRECLFFKNKFGNRKSLSKTDLDATFMHMKEDHMRNGQLKPGYNIQIGVESEYIIGLGAFSDRNDVQTLIPFLERVRSRTRRTIERIIADAGYESRENYIYLKENGQTPYIKPQNYEISKTRAYRTNPYSIENMLYDTDADTYTCPNGDVLHFYSERTEKTSAGYEVKTRYYRNNCCEGCPHFGKCHKSTRGFREIKVSPEFLEQRKESLENITSEEGTMLRVNRSIQVEGAFGVIKQDFGFRRFLMRGKKNIEMQFFLLAFAYDIEKLWYKTKFGRLKMHLFALNAS